jgi:hypothetical protein
VGIAEKNVVVSSSSNASPPASHSYSADGMYFDVNVTNYGIRVTSSGGVDRVGIIFIYYN